MGKSSKKSDTKVKAAASVVAPPSKPLKKGKREAEAVIEEKPVASNKKQKKDEVAIKQAIAKQKADTKITKKNKVESSSSSEEDSDSSESEEEVKVKPVATVKVPVKMDTDSSSDDDSSSDEPVKPAVATKNGTVRKPAAKGKTASSSSSEDESESDSEEVEAAAAVVAPPSKPLKKGRREAEAVIEKPVASNKKQKKDEVAVKQAIAKQKADTKITKKNKVESSSSSEEDSDSSESEEEMKVKPVAAVKVPVKMDTDSSSDDDSSSDEPVKPAVATKNGTVRKPAAKGKTASSSSSEDESESDSEEEPRKKVAVSKNESSEDDSDESDSDDETPAKKPVGIAKNGSVAVAEKTDESSDSSDSDDDSDEDKNPPKTAPAKSVVVSKNATNDSSSDSESDNEDDSDDETPAAIAAISKKPSSTNATKKESSSEESSDDEESSEEDEQISKTPKKKDTDVKMVDAGSAKSDANKAAQTPQTPQAATGSKTLFVGNLSFNVEQADVENFFKDAGEIADVRFATDRDSGSFKGFGHVEFATVEAAQKALELNGQELLGRPVRLDLARERGEYTPRSGNENSFKRDGKPQGQTIFVRGFDTSAGEDQIRSGLEKHFGVCGEISRVSIPKDYEGGVKGIAYMDFSSSDGFSKALELDQSDFEGSYITVEEAKPRGDSRESSGFRGGPNRGRRGGRDNYSSRGRGRDNYSSPRGRGFNSRGHGPNRPSMATPGTGKKTRFDD